MANGARVERLQQEASYRSSSISESPVSGVRARSGSADVINVLFDDADDRRLGPVDGLLWVLRGYALVGVVLGVAWTLKHFL
jgi:hypothetical protein